MTCADATPLLELELDGELDSRSILELGDHVARCPSCARQSASLHALSDAARAHLIRYEPPPGLERRLFRAAVPRRRLAWSAAGASAIAAVALLAVWPPRQDALVKEAVDAHARSLQLDHATDVVSTDQHTVKPWFQGKIGFAVPVRDYAADGFPLAGGRLDYLAGRPAAALVYRHGLHLVNLFVLDSPSPRDAALASSSERGFSSFRWSSGGFLYVLVSDVNAADLGVLARRMATDLRGSP